MKKDRIIKELVIFAVSLLCFYSLNDVKVPLSTSLFYALVFSEVAVVAPAIALVVSFLRYKSTIMLADAFLTAAGAILIRSVCKKRDRRPGAESVIFILLSQSPYVAFYEGEIINKLVYTAVITVFYFVSAVAVNTIYHKNITAKPSLYEVLCCAALYTAVTLGIMNFAGANVYKAISVFLLLFAVKLYKTPTAAMAQTFLALPIAIYTGDIGYFAFFAALFFVAYVLKDAPAVLSAIALPATDAAFAFLLDFYADYGYIEALFVFIPAFLFALLPTRLFDRLSEKGYMGGDRLSVRTIARVKSNLSGKVYDLASAFAEMNGALEVLSQTTFQKRAAAQKICALCYERACVKCSNHHICDLKPDKLVELGISKGRLTLVDLPKDFMDDCINPNPLIFEINRLIEGFNRRMEQLKKADDLKNILSLSALGISRRLEEVAFELSAAERVDKKRERALSEYLLRRGVKTYGIVVCSDDVVEMLIPDSADVDFIVKAVSDFSDAKFAVRSSQKTGEGLTYLELRPAASLKVAFGVSAVTKSDREASGDVHSLIKLSEEKLLVALSDGMGSGKVALSTSSASVGLIEGMLKAGIRQDVVLTIVNELVSVSTEDNFSAVDLAVVDLGENTFDFIKIGAPYGFIVSDEGIRFIEGSSLPIGILSEIKPTTAHAGASGGDVLVLSSDGVTDAFGSSSDFIEFLRSAPNKNPQALADSVVKKALEKTHGIAGDDMTCVCVRLY